MKILVTGVAGFIGMHVARALLERGDEVLGLDNLNGYYDPQLKLDRLGQLTTFRNFTFTKTDIADLSALELIFGQEKPKHVVHLAAQAGMRHSLKEPHAYIQSNLVGFGNILELSRRHDIEHLVYASSSSVYGTNPRMPLSVSSPVDHPPNLYAASKKANELMAHAYSQTWGLPTTGLRYFTVYGPWGRPDMAPWLFTSSILEGRPINVFNHGNMKRDFTYIDDITKGTIRVLDCTAKPHPDFNVQNPDPGSTTAPYRIYNIGNQQPVELITFIDILENALQMEAKKNFFPMQSGDMIATWADVESLRHDTGFAPCTPLTEGIEKWVKWYLQYHGNCPRS
jgi:UDP-glucuronate 4-epimerase